MKIRQGFVSNSSSSSFIVAVPKGTELSAEWLMEAFCIPVESPLYDLNYGIAEFIASAATATTAEELINDWGYDSVEAALDDNTTGDIAVAVKYAANGFDVYRLFAADDSGSGIEVMLCNTELDIRSKTLAIVGGGGY